MNLHRWTAWMPHLETPDAWRAWARGDVAFNAASGAAADPTPPPAQGIPPLLRRRTALMGRAVLQVLSDPALPYTGQPMVFCSQRGELARSLAIQQELAQAGQVSPQQFSMAVHNATGGLFMMAQKANAPLTALAACEETALAGLWEAQIQLAEAPDAAVWLVYGEEPLPEAYRAQAAPSAKVNDYFAVLFELTSGEDFCLAPETVPQTEPAPAPLPALLPASPLDLLRFFLRPDDVALLLSPRGGWTLRRQHPAKT
jgi:hypothetical protein